MKKWIYSALGATLLALGAWAVTPLGTAFTYQGQLMESGVPAAGFFDFRFNLYDDPDPAAGTLLGTTDKLAVAVASGVFTVELDFGNVFQGGEALWLQVEVRPAGAADLFTTLSPTQPLTAAPYAVFALSGNEGPQGPPGTPADTTAIDNLELEVCRLHSELLSSDDPLPFASCPRIVFVTGEIWNGDLGGPEGGDFKCQYAANAASLNGSFKAWLSGSGINAKDRLIQGTGPYRRVDGVQVADSFADILDCTGGSCLDAPINVTESGGSTGSQLAVWTGTGADGLELPGQTCSSWHSRSGDLGTAGGVSYTNERWTDFGTSPCYTNGYHLYCFQQ